jgi:stage II sporulation protein GA (sporulation sigma-E factor processing peptidase)
MEEGVGVKVYFDLIWLFNFSLDFLLIWLTASLLRLRLKKRRTVLAAALGASYAVFIFFPGLGILYTHIVKFIFAIGMIAIAFGYRDLQSYVRSLATFYLVSFVAGGGIFAIHYYYLSSSEIVSGIVVTRSGGTGVHILGSVVVVGFVLMLWFSRHTFASVEKRKQLEVLLAHVHIELLGNRIECLGLVDTGNQLSDPITRTPVMILETSQLSHCLPKHLLDMIQSPDMDQFYSGISEWDGEIEWQHRLRLIPYRGVNKAMQFMVALKPDKVIIQQDQMIWELTRVLIGLDGGTLSKDGDYHAIIHPSLMLQQTS